MTTIAPALCPMELRPLGDCPLVSVLMPLHNYEQFVASAISSVLEQTYRNFELIICDDGSSDGSLRIARAYASCDSRVRVIRQENRGQASALNAAFREHRGEITCIIDADDAFLPDKLQRLLDYYRAHPDVGLLVHSMILLDQHDTPSDRIPFLSRFEHGWIGDKLILRGGRWRFMPSSALSFRSDVGAFAFPIPEEHFRKNGETLIYTLLPLFTCVGYIKEPLSYYRMHESNMSGYFMFDIETLRSWESSLILPNTAVNERLASLGYAQRLDLSRNLDLATIRFKIHMLETQPLGVRLEQFRKLMVLTLKDDLLGVGGKSLVLGGHLVSMLLSRPARQWIFNRMLSPSPLKRILQRFSEPGRNATARVL